MQWIGQKWTLSDNRTYLLENIFDLSGVFVLRSLHTLCSSMALHIIWSSCTTWINVPYLRKIYSIHILPMVWLHLGSPPIIFSTRGYLMISRVLQELLIERPVEVITHWYILAFVGFFGDYRRSTPVVLVWNVLLELYEQFEFLILQQESSGTRSTTLGHSGKKSFSRNKIRTPELQVHSLKNTNPISLGWKMKLSDICGNI